jgi:hypothetical protein
MKPEEINILVTIAFRERGFNAYSNDIKPCSGGHPEWHILGCAKEALKAKKWHCVIAHPPCTFIANSGVRWLFAKDGSKMEARWKNLSEGTEFFKTFLDFPCDLKATENPIPHKHAGLPKYSQTIQPWEFGHTTSKRTCLWLTGLPPLKPTKIIPKEERTQEIWLCPPGPERQAIRSKTFPGIAQAMAEQWGDFMIQKLTNSN